MDTKYTQTVNGTVVERGTFKIDASKKPMPLDLIITEGTDAGTVQLGVAEVTASTLRGKLAPPGVTTRPTDFAPAEGYGTFTAVKVK